MLSLTKQGAGVGSVFSLMGTQDNELASVMGFALSRSPQLAAALTKRVARAAGVVLKAVGPELSLALEVAADSDTDLEIRHGTTVFIVTPEPGWRGPSAQQLLRAADRLAASCGQGVLVFVSHASPALVAQSLPAAVRGVPVVHLSWADVVDEVDEVIASGRGLRERMWLDEFRLYLMEDVMRVRRVEDSWTYCVVVNDEKPGGTATYREIVTEQRKYFHPYGVGDWPTEPPNFLAFRWEGAVRRIHRVVGFEVVPDLADRWPEMTGPTTARPHAVYDLGPRLPPHEPIANGSLRVSAKLWVLLDQLQTSPTLAQAHARSKELSNQA